MEAFWTACGGRGPLVLEVEGGDGSPPIRHALDRPSLIIGRGPRSDLLINDPEVSRRHAYLQVIGGHLFFVDLESRTGIRDHDGVVASGWIGPRRSIQIGSSWVRLAAGAGGATNLPEGWNPLKARSMRGVVQTTPSLTVCEGGDETTIPIVRTLTLVGGSRRCKIRLSLPGSSRFVAALVRASDGLWIIDLRSSSPVTVNGTRSVAAKLHRGDRLGIGGLVMSVDTPEIPGRQLLPSTTSAVPSMVRPSDPSLPPDALDLRPFLGQVVGIQQQTSDQFSQVIQLMTQLFGTMHREMVELVRDELEQIRRLSDEMQAFRSELAATPATDPHPGAPPRGPSSTLGDSSGPRVHRDPGEVHLLVSERLAGFERERQGRWGKIMKIINGVSD